MSAKAGMSRPRRILIIVENLPCPFDRRVWQEARALHAAGYRVSIICPKGTGYDRGFDVIHACNPPDTIFLIARLYRLLGKKFLFDHHDINPELYEAKFKRRDFFYKVLLALERWTFRAADVSIATN